jgi:lysophospholipase L1-like esterase
MVEKSLAALSAAVLLGLTLTPAQAAATQAATHMVALGDSYGSGVGGNDYRQGTQDTCWRSLNSPSEEVVRQLKNAGFDVAFDNVTCSGATINDVRQPYHGAVQLNALRTETRLVFLTIGGNDIGMVELLKKCLAPNDSCAGAPAQAAKNKLAGMAVNLIRLLGEIKARSPRAKIVLLGYGQPIASGPNAPGTPGVDLDLICAPQYFSADERRDGGRLLADLDLMLRLTAKGAELGGIAVTFISPYDSSWPLDTRLDPKFQGRSVCDTTTARQFYRGFDAVESPPPPFGSGDAAGHAAVLHMNRRGYAALANLIITEAPALAH